MHGAHVHDVRVHNMRVHSMHVHDVYVYGIRTRIITYNNCGHQVTVDTNVDSEKREHTKSVMIKH